VSPPNNSTGVAIDTLLTWQPLSTDYSYNFNIAKDVSFSDIKIDTNCTKPQYQATLDINTQYYWRVRVTIPEVEFTWSDTWSFITGDKSGVQPISPVNELEIRAIPNPSFGSVKIVYNLPEPGTVNIKIMDMLGSTVFEPVHDFYSAGGEYVLDYDCSRLSSGVYFISVSNGGRVATMRWCVVR
jgi:hypothetical protein